jgi:putative ABC transport system permease protein
MKQTLSIASYLAFKEVWRNKGRFLLVALVIGLITLLVLFIAALGEGLGNGNREYISKLDAELIAFQSKSEFVIAASRLGRDRLAAVRRVEGVADAAMLGTARASLILSDDEPLNISLLGVEPGRTGEPSVLSGRQLSTDLASEAIIDRNTAIRSNLQVNDTLTIRVTQGTRDEFFDLRVVGISDGQQFSLQPSVFVPFFTWDRIRPKSEAEVNSLTSVGNVVLVKLDNPDQIETISQRITDQVNNIEVATISETIQAFPGYSAQQSTLNTQGGFTLFIGVLVIGGFFQIQILQKVAQIGVLKAIGAANPVVAMASIIQIVIITTIGVIMGGLLAFIFSLTFPPTIPIVFNSTNSAVALILLLLIGPIGGLVSIRYAVRIEPLKALGLSS